VSYIVASDVKTFLSIDSSSDDTLITALITRAQKYIEQWTGRLFEASTDSTKKFDAVADVYEDGLLLLWGKRYDLAAITSITNGDGTTVTSSQYVTEPRNDAPYQGVRLLSSAGVSWTYEDDPQNAITIVGRWVYSNSPPNDVKQATIDLVAYMYRRRGVEGAGLDRVMVSPSGVTMAPPGFPDTVMCVVRDRRRWWRGW
jgi:uncharacterized phiE125 gp8 family phage protein